MSRPKALDLFCGAGGAGMGLHRAGFDVVGVDIKPQPRYPFEFHHADAMTFPLDGFDFIWASPPCQGYSRLRHLPWLKGRTWPLLINATRDRLRAAGVPFVVENVEDAPLKGVLLCGQMFGLPVYRHRLFETSILLLSPDHPRHREVIGHGRMINDRGKGTLNAGSRKGAWGTSKIVTVAGGQFRKADGERALGIDWMSKGELAQAIPPAYGQWIGEQMMPAVLRLRDLGQPDGAGGPDVHITDVLDQRPIPIGLDLKDGHAGSGVAVVNDLGEPDHVADPDIAGSVAHGDKYRLSAAAPPLQAETAFIPRFQRRIGGAA